MRLSPFLPIAIVWVVSALCVGCSERAARIAGNERLIRGSEGFGTTGHIDTLVDRDTYVSPRTALFEPHLLAGREGAYEAWTLFTVTAWSLPDSTNAILGVDSLRLFFELDGAVDDYRTGNLSLGLWTAVASWDTTTVDWTTRPIKDRLLASVSPFDATTPFTTIELDPLDYGLVQGWASDPDSGRFLLAPQTTGGVVGLKAGTGRFRMVFRTGPAATDTIVFETKVSSDLTVHTPVSSTGSEQALLLGGLFRAETVLHAPMPQPPPGFSINKAAFVTYLDPTSPRFGTGETADIEVHRIHESWPESAQEDSLAESDAASLIVLTDVPITATTDSLVIPIPTALALDWLLNPATNYGVLVRVREPYTHLDIRLLSRESSRPPKLRISATSPPPGRF